MQDLKPRFHVSRLHGSDDTEDDVCCYIFAFVIAYLIYLIDLFNFVE